MKNSKIYLINVLLTILMTFAIVGEVALRHVSICSDEKWSLSIIDDNNISSKVRNNLEKYFNDKYNATGINADVYMDALTEDWIDNQIKNVVKNGLDYTNGKSDNYGFKADFSELNSSISDFFNAYADENNYVKDSGFEKKIETAQKNAQNIVSSYCDVFKFDKLKSEGVLPQVRHYLGIVNNPVFEILLIISIAVFISLLILVNKKNIKFTLYWAASALIISGIIMLIPCIYINAVDYFDAFIIKQEQIFLAFTSFMYNAVNSVMYTSIGLVTVGAVLMIIFSILKSKKNN